MPKACATTLSNNSAIAMFMPMPHCMLLIESRNCSFANVCLIQMVRRREKAGGFLKNICLTLLRNMKYEVVRSIT